MPKSDFIPNRDGDFLAWHDQIKTAADNIGATLDITAADLSNLNDDNSALHEVLTLTNAADAAARQVKAQKNTTRRATEQRARTLAKRVKLHANYTTALGQQLGIEGPEDTTDMSTARPTLTITVMPHGSCQIGFPKLKADGVNIYSRRGTETAYTYLARDTESPYIDNRPLLNPTQPETRQYKAIFVIGDDEIGLESDVAEGVCKP